MHSLDNEYKSRNGRGLSFFEFWPSWLMYLPVGFMWVLLSIRYRSLTLPFLANPCLTLSGMVGVGKSELLKQIRGIAKKTVLPWIAYNVDDGSYEKQVNNCIKQAKEKGIAFPFVCKPDIGCRGVGVKLVKDKKKLVSIFKFYPNGASIICQKLASYEMEAGVFYVKNPKTNVGKIVSLTIKVLPKVVGDGVHTLSELISLDTRAGKLKHLYYNRHKKNWSKVIKKDKEYNLIFSASHSKGAIFLNAEKHITDKLTRKITEIMDGLPKFYYGRLDVKFKDVNSLINGKNLEIVEINGASSESIHIWDENAKFIPSVKALLWQYHTLFKIGDYHRKKGMKVPSLKSFFLHWKMERKLSKNYPLTD